MKKGVSAIVLVFVVGSAFGADIENVDGIPVRLSSVVSSVDTVSSRALEALLADAPYVPLADLTVSSLVEALQLVSLAQQESAHVHQSARLSLLLPGLGQWVNGDTGRAAGFALTDAVVQIATLAVAGMLLPPAVTLANLNYMQSSLQTIRDRWLSVTPAEFLPAFSVALSGSLLSLIVRHLAAEDARAVAVEAIEAGRISFVPRPIVATGE